MGLQVREKVSILSVKCVCEVVDDLPRDRLGEKCIGSERVCVCVCIRGRDGDEK